MLGKVLLFVFLFASIEADYWSDRDALIASEQNLIIGSDLGLTAKEQQANAILMQLKQEEFDYGFANPAEFLAAQHFFKARSSIERSQVFQVLKMLPKGGSLHSHDTALASGEYLYNLTYSDNLYGCVQNGRLTLKFFNVPDASCAWELVENLRASNSTFDDYLKTQISFIVENPLQDYSDINVAWGAFLDTFNTVTPMLTYAPVWKEYFYQVLKELYEDNVMYIEFRTTLPDNYDLDGNIYGPIQVAGFYKEVSDQFKLDYPDFQGVKIIYAPLRSVDNTTMDQYVTTALELRNTYQDFLAGFDLVGQEDTGTPLIEFISQLQTLRTAGIDLFCHAGETNWYGAPTDFNLVDAVLLGTKRIGHGYALFKHPEVLRLVKENQIAIEVSPISNQVLKLVEDVRNHPANYFISNNYPVVITNDDPCFWGATALSYDWYIAFMGMTSKYTDLRFLKKLALNSYWYNSMSLTEKNNAIMEWNARWDVFIDNVIARKF